VGSFESFKEFLKDLVLGLLARLDIWVLVGSVDSSDIVDINPTVSILVKLLVGLSDNLLPVGVHWTSDSTDEFIEFKETTSVEIEIAEKLLDLALGETEHVVSDGLGELVLVEGSRVVIIHNFELPLKTNKSSSTSRDKLNSKSLSKFLRASVSGSATTLGGGSHWTTIELGSELVVIKGSTFINIIDAEKSLQVL